MNGNTLRNRLHQGQRVYGTLVVSPSSFWPNTVRHSGADFVFIDTEHIALDRETVSWMCRAYHALGLPPVVRVPSPDPFEACKVLDGGACGVIAPYVESADEVRTLVGAAKLRPLKGRRLAEALHSPATMEAELHEYLQRRNADIVLIVNIESVPALEKLDEILSVPGLDGVLVGPHDLSCSLGIPEQYRHPRFNDAVCTIIRKTRAAGLGVGVHFWEGLDLEVQWARAGANLIMHSSDLLLFGQTLRRELTEIRQALADLPEPGGNEDVEIV
jgi:4-hydroxy-2-oxoheptanedioate aldolase